MEGRTTGARQQQSVIGIDELSSMLCELMCLFERSVQAYSGEGDSASTYPCAQLACDWVSPSSLTRVMRYGSSASLRTVLKQVPGAIANEYDVLHENRKVFSWCEYRWPHLQPADDHRYRSGQVSLPARCLDDLMQFHVTHATDWLRRYKVSTAEPSVSHHHSIQINEVGVVTQADLVQIL